MKKLLSFALVGFSLSLFAKETNVVQIDETRVQPIKVSSFEVEPSVAANTAVLRFNVTYSNSCVAGSRGVGVLTSVERLPEGQGSLEYAIKVTAHQTYMRKIMCPMIYRPVTVTYAVTLNNLTSNADYLVEVETVNEKGLVHVN